MPKDKYMMLQNHNIIIIRLLLLLLLKISYFVSQFVIQNLLNVQLISHDFFFLNYHESSVFNSSV